ncbi:ABC transporter substrate-binding protein [Acidovorax sp. SUPP2522]|uniref:ABC transporter substrate-binding protein n=1 Tax=unclassified Acidovorax TaxID=2684926 RepID=UPI00234B0983|nr:MULTISPECIES: ABC transporter substrate-binding protein [unclassified Acidovorax]WCM96141.1 ABC transporter substrate-binding protein [Acidovorax sp. GBBC 1281]GKT19935.1 ABC transporter substrate-binding protein [Acidovorax sp. SUPP2522]
MKKPILDWWSRVLGGTLSGALIFATGSPALAQEVLYVAGYGGSSEAVIKQDILVPFAATHNVKIEYVAGTSAANLARLQAQQGNPEIDVAILDDGPMQQAVSLGLCAPVAPFSGLDDLYDLAKTNGDGRSIGVGIVATGLAYNTEEFARRGWPAPTSWSDLATPAYKGKILLPSITNSYGLHALLALSKALGDAGTMEPAFDFVREKIGPNVLSFESSSGKISELFQTREVLLGVWGSGRALALSKSGFPVAFVTPKEGAVALQTTICPVTGSNAPQLSQALLQAFFTPQAQAALAREAGWGPTNRKTVLTPEIAATVTYGPQAVSQLIPVDWKAVNAERANWTKRWTREVEGG